MFRFVSIFLVTAIAAAGYLFYAGTPLPSFNQDFISEKNNLENSANVEPSSLKQAPAKADEQTKLQPSIVETQDTQLELPLPILTEQEKQQALAHVKSITTSPEEPIAIKSADHFVTADQILQLPELQKPQIVKIETTDPVVAVIVSAAKKDNAALSVAQTNQNNANAAQSFAVKIPSFKKTIITPKPEQAALIKPATLNNATPADVLLSKNGKALANTSNSPSKTSNTATKETSTIKVLTTVTGKITAPTTPIKVNTSSPKVIPVILEAPPIFNKLKANVAEISDINISDLTKLVTQTATPVTPTLAAQPSSTIAVAKVENALPTTTTNSTIDTLDAQQTTTAPLKDQNITALKPLVTIAEPIEKILVTESERNRIKLKELLSETDSDKKRIFYLHAVDNADEQGIWGIIQKGLMGTFSKGISLEQANGTIRALIPGDADELLTSKESSFLGKLLSYKVLTTYVYNYEQGNIGKNPDFIKPGQQLIIVTFTEQELMAVYQHFKNSQAVQ
ncbi:MAG: hypothetical protein V7784_11845 [Oceanospirillaceae bacterium]